MRTVEETVIILHFEDDPKRINALEEMEILKATTSDRKLNINPLYQMLQPLQDQTATTSHHMLNIMQNINPLYQMLQPL